MRMRQEELKEEIIRTLKRIKEACKSCNYERTLEELGYLIAILEINRAEPKILSAIKKALDAIRSNKKLEISDIINNEKFNSNNENLNNDNSLKWPMKKITFHELFKELKAKTKTIIFENKIDDVIGAKIATTKDEVLVLSFLIEKNGNKLCRSPKRFQNLNQLLNELSKYIDRPLYLKI